MSLREHVLQTRVDALEVAIEALVVTIRTHLPSASDMAESAMSCVENACKFVEKHTAQTLSANRVCQAAQYDRLLHTSDLNALLSIYIPLLKQHDTDGRFFKKLTSNGPYSYVNSPHELDLSQIARDAYLALPHTGGLPKYDNTRLTLHVGNGNGRWHVTGMSGTELYQGEWVSYGIEYDGQTAPLFERQVIRAMSNIFRDLGVPEAAFDPNFELQGRNGVVHGLTLSHHTWRLEGRLLGEVIEGQGVILKPAALPKSFGCGYQISLWRDNDDVELEIQITNSFSDNYRLRVPRDSQVISLVKYGQIDEALRPSDLNIVTRARFKALIGFVLEILNEERTDLMFRDPTGIDVGWDVTTIPYPEEA